MITKCSSRYGRSFKAAKKTTAEDQPDENKGQKELELLEVVLPDEYETVLADRVELSSRIMRQSSSDASSVREALMPPFQEAVDILADHGSPITQVKMLRACQNVPEIPFIEALRKPLNSPINWVRNQALIIIGGSQAGARAVGSDLATEIGYDLATGLFPLRLPAYWKAACSAKNRGYWWSLFMGTFCYSTNLIFLLTAAVIIYYGFWSLGSLEPRKFQSVQSQLFNPFKPILNWTCYDEDKWKLPEWMSSRSQPKKEQLKIEFHAINFSILSQPICIAIPLL
jgi:hypothetical protein